MEMRTTASAEKNVTVVGGDVLIVRTITLSATLLILVSPRA
jgi:hypothetical protein